MTTRYVDLQPVGMGAFGLVWYVSSILVLYTCNTLPGREKSLDSGERIDIVADAMAYDGVFRSRRTLPAAKRHRPQTGPSLKSHVLRTGRRPFFGMGDQSGDGVKPGMHLVTPTCTLCSDGTGPNEAGG